MSTQLVQGQASAVGWLRGELGTGILVIILAHACDLASTYLRTPDLAHEVSPTYLALVARGYGGWGALLTIKSFGVLLSIGLLAFYLRNRGRFYPTERGLSFHDFLHHAHSVNAVRLEGGRWLTPSPLLLLIWLAFTTSIGSAAYAYFLAIHNLLGTPLLEGLAGTVAPGAIFLVTAVVFWRLLYDDYRRRGEDE